MTAKGRLSRQMMQINQDAAQNQEASGFLGKTE